MRSARSGGPAARPTAGWPASRPGGDARVRRPGPAEPWSEAWPAQAGAGAVASGQAWNGRPAFHMACSTTPILRASATAARLNPRRWTSPSPHAFSADGRCTRTSGQAAASNS